jgi:mRNA-degrading endonuclease YafQ of YafQ-DinJ toxin-antitoxin module
MLFASEPFHPLLNNHPLTSDRTGQRTINVTGDWRIIFKELSDGKYELVELVDIGTHSQLYG